MDIRGPFTGYDKEADEVIASIHGRQARIPSSSFPEFADMEDAEAKESAVCQAAQLALAGTIRIQVEQNSDGYDFTSAKAEFLTEENLKKPFSKP